MTERIIPIGAPEVPRSISRARARAALYLAGYLDQIEGIMADPTTPALVKIAWQDAQTFERDSASLQQIASMLDLSDADLDNLFRTASEITL